MTTSLVKSDRISCRITPEHKQILERAAARRGLSVTDYLVSTALQTANDELRQEDSLRLPREDWEALLALLENPPAPGPVLVEAMKEFMLGEFDGGKYRW